MRGKHLLRLVILAERCYRMSAPDMKRRNWLKHLGTGLVSGLSGYALGLTAATTGLGVRPSSSLLERKVAFGAGTNLKFMPDPNGNPTAPMREVFAFTPDIVQCQVEDNLVDFAMQTYELGNAVIGAHQFYMVMVSDKVSPMNFDEDAGGSPRVTIRGTLSCATEAATASVKIGSRAAVEPAQFKAVAVDASARGSGVGSSFAITAYFNKTTAPVNHSIFGPEPTFTGKMVTGKITITRLDQLIR